MEIKNENIMAAYEAADESGKQMLRAMFPDMEWIAKQPDNRPITERVKTWEDACKILGVCPEEAERQWADGGLTMPDEIAYQKLRMIVSALNEGWQPQFTKKEYRWYPYFILYTEDEIALRSEDWKRDHYLQPTSEYRVSAYAGIACTYTYNAPSDTTALLGSRLCFKSETIANYAGKQFIKLWMDLYLIRK